MSSDKKIRVAWMGFGGRGSSFIDGFRKLNLWGTRVTCAGVYDTSEESARKSMKRLKEEYPFYSDPGELFEKGKPDACIIASFECAHLENYRVAVKYGIPVMVEKPLEVSLESAAEFLRLAQNVKAPTLMAFNMRFAPIINRAKEIIDAGDVGTIHSMRFHNNVHYGSGYFRCWMRLRKNVGSLFCEKGAHDLDIMNFLSGSFPASLYAVSKRYEYGGDAPNDLQCRNCPKEHDCPESMLNKHLNLGIDMPSELQKVKDFCVWANEADVNDDDICVIEFENGMQGVYVQTYYTPYSYKSRIYCLVGSKGLLEIDLDEYEGDIVLYPRYGSKLETRREHFDYHREHAYNGDVPLTRHFYKVIIGEEKPRSTIRDGYISVVSALAATRSGDERKIIDVKSLYKF